MQIGLMLVFLAVWLLIWWLGSTALEATGMERAKARFQALSAITGTGFTTGEAESVVNHPKRRRIASWLIFLGNIGVVAFIILLILFVLTALDTLSLVQILVLVLFLIIFALLVWLATTKRVSNYMLGLFRRNRYLASELSAVENLHQAGDYGIARLEVGKKAAEAGSRIKDSGFAKHGIQILALVRGDEKVQPLPDAEERLLAGDYLLCYGKTAVINSLARNKEA